MIVTLNTSNSPPLYRNLMAIGLLGTVYRLPDDANIVNDVIDATLQQPTQYRMCRAIATGMTGDSDYAKRVLAPYVEDHPDDEAARVAMAIALTLAGDEEGPKTLHSVLAVSTDMSIRMTAGNMLSFMARYQ